MFIFQAVYLVNNFKANPAPEFDKGGNFCILSTFKSCSQESRYVPSEEFARKIGTTSLHAGPSDFFRGCRLCSEPEADET